LIFREVEDPDLIARTKQGKVEAYKLLVSRWEKRDFNYYLLHLVSDRSNTDSLANTQRARLEALLGLRRVGVPMASAILALLAPPPLSTQRKMDYAAVVVGSAASTRVREAGAPA
jgi:hypothetical protein